MPKLQNNKQEIKIIITYLFNYFNFYINHQDIIIILKLILIDLILMDNCLNRLIFFILYLYLYLDLYLYLYVSLSLCLHLCASLYFYYYLLEYLRIKV